MRKYEAMFIIKPELSPEEKKGLFDQISDVIVKNKGNVSQAGIWSEKKKLYFSIKKCQEGVYYLVNFSLTDPALISELKRLYELNENILRVLITRQDK
ncbi:MAG: 30S ribosomal protein S6 [Candidatus Omnitrophica bacterium]|nr:30S ribosomal protein S6 [Candidatus Omnitrophota bacterium]MBU4473146.1 30S ribosomal protein S6 [Candidatus Omnitrophota bacterium]MCG2706433.1 30S ribosomal protein S6 [Candidatus Omnitrophota bacterium]